MKAAVVGAGKMGLPLAAHMASRGHQVVACDVSQAVVDTINAGGCPIDEPGVPELIAAAVQAGTLTATTDTPAGVADADLVVVIVPALLTDDRDAELSILDAVTHQVAPALKKGALLSYETTVPVGTTREHFGALLRKAGREPGEADVLVGFSPERVKSGLVLERLATTPKVVGGIDQVSADRAEALYAEGLGAPVINVGSLETAEFVKLAGMLYRDINLGFVNQLATYAEAAGIDLPSVIEAVNTNGEAHLLIPGIGVGGHCTPVYPYFLIRHGERLGMPMTLAEEARRLNDRQPFHQVQRLHEALGTLRDRPVLILGLGFRPGVKEAFCSPAFLLRDALLATGAKVFLNDPLYSDEEIRDHGFEPGAVDADPGWDAVVLNTSHDVYHSLDWTTMKEDGLLAVLDGRNLWDGETVRAAGLEYIAVGRPSA